MYLNTVPRLCGTMDRPLTEFGTDAVSLLFKKNLCALHKEQLQKTKIIHGFCVFVICYSRLSSVTSATVAKVTKLSTF